MPYKDKELARQKGREYRARRRQDPEWLEKQAAKREKHREWISKNRERYLELMRRSKHKRIKEISKSYVAGVFHVSTKDLPDDLYEAYAAALKTQRLIKEMMK